MAGSGYWQWSDIGNFWYWVGSGEGDPTTKPTTAPVTDPSNEGAIPPQVTGAPLDIPVATKSKGRMTALKNYTEWVKWKRKELENLIGRYRTAFPKQIEAYKTSAYGALPEAKKQMWGNMYANLDQRGLSDSSSFRAGARTDLESWLSGEKGKIADTAQGMEAGAQNAILTALGQPNYAQLYSNWISADDQQNAYNFREYEKKRGY